MPSARDVSADPSRTMTATASNNDRRPRLTVRRPRSATRHAISTSDEQLDQAVQSIRQLAEEMNRSARDELAHILESEKPDGLSLIMDIAERDAANTLPLESDAKLLPPTPRNSDNHDHSLLEEKRQVRRPSIPTPFRWRRWVGSLIFTVLIVGAAALLFIVAPRLLSGAQEGREARWVLTPSNLSETRYPSLLHKRNDELSLVVEATRGKALPSIDLPFRDAAQSSTIETQIAAPDVKMPSVDAHHHNMPQKSRADERQEPGPAMPLATQQTGTQHPVNGHVKGTRLLSPPTDVSSVTEKQLLQRAERLLQNRDISGARLILERAITLGSAKAAYHLAHTYDPAILDGWQVRGISGDTVKSRELHELARTLESRSTGANAASP